MAGVGMVAAAGLVVLAAAVMEKPRRRVVWAVCWANSAKWLSTSIKTRARTRGRTIETLRTKVVKVVVGINLDRIKGSTQAISINKDINRTKVKGRDMDKTWAIEDHRIKEDVGGMHLHPEDPRLGTTSQRKCTLSLDTSLQ
jgi:hypothetical protein